MASGIPARGHHRVLQPDANTVHPHWGYDGWMATDDIHIRIPNDITQQIRTIATQDERSLNRTIIRLVRLGIAAHQTTTITR